MPTGGPVDAVGRLTLDGVLVVGVIALWKALSAKDAQLIAMTAKVTEVMTQVLDSNKELRGVVNELRDVVTEFRDDRGAVQSSGPSRRSTPSG